MLRYVRACRSDVVAVAHNVRIEDLRYLILRDWGRCSCWNFTRIRGGILDLQGKLQHPIPNALNHPGKRARRNNLPSPNALPALGIALRSKLHGEFLRPRRLELAFRRGHRGNCADRLPHVARPAPSPELLRQEARQTPQ